VYICGGGVMRLRSFREIREFKEVKEFKDLESIAR
jgi:hypothetical protein